MEGGAEEPVFGAQAPGSCPWVLRNRSTSPGVYAFREVPAPALFRLQIAPCTIPAPGEKSGLVCIMCPSDAKGGRTTLP